MTTNIKKGDVVQLKSGGPWMTVTDVEDGEASVTWFDNNKELRTAEFDVETLDQVSTNNSSGSGGFRPNRNNNW